VENHEGLASSPSHRSDRSTSRVHEWACGVPWSVDNEPKHHESHKRKASHGEEELEALQVEDAGKQAEKKRKLKLIQAQLSLGQKNPLIKCLTCGFSYNKTVASDVKTHKMYHYGFVNPTSIGKLRISDAAPCFTEDCEIGTYLKNSLGVDEETTNLYYMIKVDADSKKSWRECATMVLHYIQGEVFNNKKTPAADLWSYMENPQVSLGQPTKRFSVYMTVLDGKVVSFLQTERTWCAESVDKWICSQRSQPDESATGAHPRYGTRLLRPITFVVHHIWTSDKCRGQGLGTRLVKYAMQDHGREIGRELTFPDVGWTHTTEDGKAFLGGLTGRWGNDGIWMEWDEQLYGLEGSMTTTKKLCYNTAKRIWVLV
jgi:hypothetical protein